MLYGVPDEYEGGAYLGDAYPGPPGTQSQYPTLTECQADASAQGWNQADCHLACDFNIFTSCGRNWYSAELRPPVSFMTREACDQWRGDHGVSEPCRPYIDDTQWNIPALRDLLVFEDKRFDGPAFRTADFFTWLAPAPSFQRACERRALFYLDDPQLMGSMVTPSVDPFVLVQAEIDGSLFASASALVVNERRGPRFEEPGPLRVVAVNSDDDEFVSNRRSDVRFLNLEAVGLVRAQDGASVFFSMDVVPELRRLRVLAREDAAPPVALAVDPASSLEGVLLDIDLGPTLVAACANGELSADLCATFDSDGDGCRDVVDPEPLTPETEPPTIVGTVSPDTLWPPDRRLRPVTVTLDVTDNCTATPHVVLESVVSSDPETVGPGDPSPDIAGAEIGTPDFEVELRAERLRGRIYTLTYLAADRVGNEARISLEVRVPHDLRRRPWIPPVAQQ